MIPKKGMEGAATALVWSQHRSTVAFGLKLETLETNPSIQLLSSTMILNHWTLRKTSYRAHPCASSDPCKKANVCMLRMCWLKLKGPKWTPSIVTTKWGVPCPKRGHVDGFQICNYNLHILYIYIIMWHICVSIYYNTIIFAFLKTHVIIYEI